MENDVTDGTNCMMSGMGGMMGWGMGLVGLLGILVLALTAAALVKYLFARSGPDVSNG